VRAFQTVSEAIEQLEPEAHTRNITMVLSIQDPVPTVIGDPRRIKQANACVRRPAAGSA
jgi:signal transduction histidine kinase